MATIPMGRIGEAGDLVGPVLFFASPAGACVTGQTLLRQRRGNGLPMRHRRRARVAGVVEASQPSEA